jgi:CRISPR-associated protein Cmr2
MTYDFLSTYDWLTLEHFTQKKAIDYLLGRTPQPPDALLSLGEVTDPATRLHLLVLALHTAHKEYARAGDPRKKEGGIISLYKGQAYQNYLDELNYLDDLGLVPRINMRDLSLLPPYTTCIQCTFTLAKPYISRDDTPFYLIDNPVRKDKVFQVPMVAPSGWKGALRSAMRNLTDNQKVLTRLFGPEKDEETYLAGSLHFYPTFFDRIGLEVINPHDHKTGTGKQPIYFECVPDRAKGTFSLLYVPLHILAKEDVAEDITLVAEGIKAMLTTYGFGAKTSSGYGLVKDELVEDGLEKPGTLRIHAALSAETFIPSDKPEWWTNDLQRDDGSLKTEQEYQEYIEGRGATYSGGRYQKHYRRAKEWWSQQQPEESARQEPLLFEKLSNLPKIACRIANALKGEKE